MPAVPPKAAFLLVSSSTTLCEDNTTAVRTLPYAKSLPLLCRELINMLFGNAEECGQEIISLQRQHIAGLVLTCFNGLRVICQGVITVEPIFQSPKCWCCTLSPVPCKDGVSQDVSQNVLLKGKWGCPDNCQCHAHSKILEGTLYTNHWSSLVKNLW